jgi:hypothetical protein
MIYQHNIIRKHLKSAVIFTVLFSLLSSCANQGNITGKPSSRWVMLGSKTIDFIGDTDAIPVSDKDSFSQLRFKIEGRGTTIKAITVTYADGNVQEVSSIDAVMSPGQFSKTIVLTGAAKRIGRVEYKFGPGTAGSGKGMMRLYGYKVVKP